MGGTFQFTHPGKGATESSLMTSLTFTPFQFTHPGKGATGEYLEIFKYFTFQFTHPGKGATSPYHSRSLILGFNSRTLGRVRLSAQPSMLSGISFQFTHPGKGATAYRTPQYPLLHRFNSRTLGRVRQCGAKLRIIGRINKRNLRLGVLS